MFGRAPKSPVSAEAGEWIEKSMRWFVSLYGQERLENLPVVLPTEEFFPDDFQATYESAQATMQRICFFLRIDSGQIHLEIFEDAEAQLARELRKSLPHWSEDSHRAAGTYSEDAEREKFCIRLKHSLLTDPMRLVATISHELCHVLLLGQKQLKRDAHDMEPLTDLLTVFSGLGIFNANSAARFTQHDDGVKHGWSFQRLGYLSEPMFGYALAVFAFERGERKPLWAKYLSVNVSSYFHQSLKVLAHQHGR